MTETSIKILTYNIHKGFNASNRRFVLHEMKEALQHINADIVFLQEIQGEHKLKQNNIDDWPDNSQFEFLADQVWHHHAYGKNAIYKSGHHGNAILSKYPFVEWENINVSLMKNASRSLLHGSMQIPGHEKKLHVICVHLGLLPFEREKQLITLTQRINSHIALGVYEVFKNITGNHARSFPAWLPILHMDRIYARGIDALHCQKLNQSPWRRLSDHTPLVASFRLR
jgi:endonuclease/exonuclease/phosphatase family metal-dependent hydrolase